MANLLSRAQSSTPFPAFDPAQRGEITSLAEVDAWLVAGGLTSSEGASRACASARWRRGGRT